MKWFKILVAALALIVFAGLYLRAKWGEAREVVHTLCVTTRPGESWLRVQERARERGLTFQQSSRSNVVPVEYLADLGTLGARYGCVVKVRDDRVVETRFAELPPR